MGRNHKGVFFFLNLVNLNKFYSALPEIIDLMQRILVERGNLWRILLVNENIGDIFDFSVLTLTPSCQEINRVSFFKSKDHKIELTKSTTS